MRHIHGNYTIPQEEARAHQLDSWTDHIWDDLVQVAQHAYLNDMDYICNLDSYPAPSDRQHPYADAFLEAQILIGLLNDDIYESNPDYRLEALLAWFRRNEVLIPELV